MLFVRKLISFDTRFFKINYDSLCCKSKIVTLAHKNRLPLKLSSLTLFIYLGSLILGRVTTRTIHWFFNVPQILYVQVLLDGTYGLSSLSEKTRKLNLLRMSSQRQQILLSYLKTLGVGPAAL